MTRIATFVAAAVLAFALAVPAFAADGRAFGEHHASHAQEMTGFTAEMNPGVMHTGFAGWTGM